MTKKSAYRILLLLLVAVLLAVGIYLLRTLDATSLPADSVIVTRVVDGDTLVVTMSSGERERVRLIGIDTPELARDGRPAQPFAREAADCARRLVADSRVTLEPDPFCADRDDYGRLLRYVWLPDGRLVNEEMIASGCGRAFTRFRFSRIESFRRSEERARASGHGLWGR
jgi:micrococcal nuclease